MEKLKAFDSGYFISKNHFAEDVVQNYLVFQPMERYFKMFLMLVMVITFITGNLKHCLMEKLVILGHLNIKLLQHLSY